MFDSSFILESSLSFFSELKRKVIIVKVSQLNFLVEGEH